MSWIAYIKSISYFLEIAPLLHQSNCLEAEMVHFIHQMQYYITFEVSVDRIIVLFSKETKATLTSVYGQLLWFYSSKLW